MRGVMFDAVKPGANLFRGNIEGARKIFIDSGEAPHNPRAVEGEFRHAHREAQLRWQARPGIARDSDVIHFGKSYAGLVEAILNRARGESGRVFHAVQAFFLDGREKPSVRQNRRGGVGVVRIDA